jgi:nitrate reductase NapE
VGHRFEALPANVRIALDIPATAPIDSLGPCGKNRPTFLSVRCNLGNERMSAVEKAKVIFTRHQELRGFLLLSVVMAPVLAVMIVAGYGFLVWFYQLMAGPPGG